jgi:hypothetical protein
MNVWGMQEMDPNLFCRLCMYVSIRGMHRELAPKLKEQV